MSIIETDEEGNRVVIVSELIVFLGIVLVFVVGLIFLLMGYWPNIQNVVNPVTKNEIHKRCTGILSVREGERILVQDIDTPDSPILVSVWLSPYKRYLYANSAVGDTVIFDYWEWEEFDRTTGKWSKESKKKLFEIHQGPNNPLRDK